MDEKTRLYVWYILVSLSTITASQIYFPQENNNNPIAQSTGGAFAYVSEPEDLLTDLTTIDRGRPNPAVSRNTDQFVNGITRFTLNINRITPALYPEVAQEDHLVLGPVTIAGAMALVLSASVGQTFNEIANFLGFTSSAANDYEKMQNQLAEFYGHLETNSGLQVGQSIIFATGIFVQKEYPLRPEFEQVSNVLFKSKVTNVDFRRSPRTAQKIINDFISERTNKKIPELLSDPPPTNTRSIIVSVFYFKASWEYPFFEGHTKWRPFYVNGRKNPSDRMVEMMSNGGEFPYYKDNGLGVQIMGFPYKGRRTTMYVILPNDSNKEKLRRLENSLTQADIDRLVSSTKTTEAVVLFPKMKLESTIELSTVLQNLGVNSLFNPYQANLALLSPGISERFNSEEAPFVSPPISRPNVNLQPPSSSQNEYEGERLVFTRFGDQIVNSNCDQIYDYVTNTSRCRQTQQQSGKTFAPGAVPLSANSGGIFPAMDVLKNLRRQGNLQNPGLYADQVIHKVYIDITESGTEAASATGFSLNRSGGRVTFRADMPFIFFIYHEDTRGIMFWGSVKSPSPNVFTRQPSSG